MRIAESHFLASQTDHTDNVIMPAPLIAFESLLFEARSLTEEQELPADAFVTSIECGSLKEFKDHCWINILVA